VGESVIDLDTLAVLDDLYDSNLYLTDLFPPYKEQVGTALNNLADAIARQDSKAVIFHAHGLKSSSAQLGALRVSHACFELETLGHSPNWPEIVLGLVRLSQETAAAVMELEGMEVERRTRAA